MAVTLHEEGQRVEILEESVSESLAASARRPSPQNGGTRSRLALGTVSKKRALSFRRRFFGCGSNQAYCMRGERNGEKSYRRSAVLGGLGGHGSGFHVVEVAFGPNWRE